MKVFLNKSSFSSGKIISINSLKKRINFLLKRNFFNIEDFKNFSNRKSIKIIKLIAKAENLKLNKLEIKQILDFILTISNNKKIKIILESTKKFFSFIVDFVKLDYLNQKKFFSFEIFFLFIFRINFKPILRI